MPQDFTDFIWHHFLYRMSNDLVLYIGAVGTMFYVLKLEWFFPLNIFSPSQLFVGLISYHYTEASYGRDNSFFRLQGTIIGAVRTYMKIIIWGYNLNVSLKSAYCAQIFQPEFSILLFKHFRGVPGIIFSLKNYLLLFLLLFDHSVYVVVRFYSSFVYRLLMFFFKCTLMFICDSLCSCCFGWCFYSIYHYCPNHCFVSSIFSFFPYIIVPSYRFIWASHGSFCSSQIFFYFRLMLSMSSWSHA